MSTAMTGVVWPQGGYATDWNRPLLDTCPRTREDLWIKSGLCALFAGNLATLIYIWVVKSGPLVMSAVPGDCSIGLGRLSGLLGEYFILCLIILVGRIPFIEKAVGFDVLNRLHRRIGYAVTLFLIGHPVLLSFGYATQSGIRSFEQLIYFATSWEDISKAMLGTAIVACMIVLCLPPVRRRLRYESWYAVHLAAYAAILLGLQHQTRTGDLTTSETAGYWLTMNYVVFGLVLLFRFMQPLLRFAIHRFRVSDVRQETPDTYSVTISGERMDRFAFEAGQFAKVHFLAKNMWVGHPFSVSVAPNNESLRFTIKIFGDYTSHIKDLRAGTPVIIDGPMGSFVERKAKSDRYLLIAGGIGITPNRSLLESLCQKKRRETHVLGANGR